MTIMAWDKRILFESALRASNITGPNSTWGLDVNTTTDAMEFLLLSSSHPRYAAILVIEPAPHTAA